MSRVLCPEFGAHSSGLVLHVLNLDSDEGDGEANGEDHGHLYAESDFGCPLVRCHERQVIIVAMA